MFRWISAPPGLMLLVAIAAPACMLACELKITNPAVPIKMFKNSRLTFAFIGKKFVKRFRPFGILAMVAAMGATGLLCCVKFTGTAATGKCACWIR